MDCLERCDNYVFININDMKWAISKLNSCLTIMTCNPKCRQKYECQRKHDVNLLFNLFSQFAENTLDPTKHKITFPADDDADVKIIIKFLEYNHDEILDCKLRGEDKLSLQLFDVDYIHTCATKQLLKKINVLETENAEINKTIAFLKEENAKLNDKLDILASFIDLAMDNNKLAEMKKAVS